MFLNFPRMSNLKFTGNSSNKFVAIEFDTHKQWYDPDDNHLGLNINNVASVQTVPLSPQGIDLAPMNGNPRFYNIWVNYDGVKKTIEVYMKEQNKDDPTPMIPSTPLLKSDLNLREVVDQNSYIGFSASTGTATQLNCIRRWNITVEYFDKSDERLKIGLGAGIPAAAVVVMVAIYCFWRKRRMNKVIASRIGEGLMRLPGMVREFEYGDLKKATDNFDDKYKLGEGGYGIVYRGILQKENLEVAVKWFSRESMRGEEDFLAELTIINRLRHKHLVPLLGWCHKNGKLLLVYEYMPNGSLDKHLFCTGDNETLSWTLRYKIASGLALALHYLHNEFDQRVVHRDLKASNIMLDSDFNARLGDFGLARAIENGKTSYAEAEGVHGTLGYVAPECLHTGKATQLSDIYGYGAVLLELVCGQKPGTKIGGYQMLVDWVWSLYREGHVLEAVDKKLRGEFVAEEAERILLLGMACSHPIASERPETDSIVQIIKESAPAPHLPYFKPAFVWPAVGDLSLTIMTDTASRWSLQHLSRESYSGYTDRSP
ncbi:hypothetical protein LguiA_013828 [Lonicera macranthoides]